jgi:hypothetical protein
LPYAKYYWAHKKLSWRAESSGFLISQCKFDKLGHVSSVSVGLLEDLKTERIILTCKEKQIHWQNNDI